MAATDLVKINRVYIDTTPDPDTQTLGVDEYITLGTLVNEAASGATVVGTATSVVTQTAPAAAPVPFADLTTAANYVNSLRTLLIAARVLK